MACYIKTTAYPGTESARVELDHSGRCTVYVSTPSQGQGHRHAWAKLVESELGIGPGQMRWVAGDTATLPVGTGTFASRSTATGGSAVQLAARELALKLKGAAAAMLECAAEDVVLIDGEAQVRGVPQRRIPLGVLVQRAAPGGALSAEHTFTSPGGHWPAGAQVALVEIDPETGCLRVRRLVAVDDCGRLLGPELVRGQVVGAAAQGIGNTVLERLVYDEAGQLLSGTFLDYPLPSATDVPPIDVEYLETPSPLNPLGVKGAGEGGIMPVAAVLSAAIDDAWQAAGVHAPLVDRLPILPEDLFRMRGGPWPAPT